LTKGLIRSLAVLAAVVLAALGAACIRAPQPAAAPPGGGVRIAIMPLEDFGEEPGGVFQVQGALERQLTRLGYGVVDEAELKRLLLRERVRRTGSVGRQLASLVGQETGAALILVGAVTQYRGGLDPCASVTSRLLEARTGRIVWTGSASATGRQYETVLGLGRVRDASRLTELVVARMLGALPAAGTAAQFLTPGPVPEPAARPAEVAP